MRAAVFPGQGTQRRGMGEDLFDRFPELVSEADAILGYSIRDLCLNNPNASLDKTEITQPAIYVVSVMRYRAMGAQAYGPAFVAGHSLGEYVALAVAGVFDFAMGLRIVQRRGQLMGEAYGGGLVAIVGHDADHVAKLLADDGIAGVEIANINSPEQVVVGGRKDKLQTLLDACAARSIRAVPLRVSGAFHTSHMAEAAEKFSVFLRSFEFAPPEIPVLSNVTGGIHDALGIRDRLVQQMVKPVRWSQCVEAMLEAGVTEFTEIGTPPILTPIISSVRQRFEARQSRKETPTAPEPARDGVKKTSITPREDGFCTHFNCERRLVSGSLGHGISGVRLVKALAKSGVLSFLDTEGLELKAIDDSLAALNADPKVRDRFGVSVRVDLDAPDADGPLIDLVLRHGVRCIEARGYSEPSAALRRFRAGGEKAEEGSQRNRVIARIATLDAASAFILGTLPSQARTKTKRLPEASQAPGVDALCVDLQAWRSNAGAPWSLYMSLLEWRDAHRRDGNGRPFFVGASGAISSAGSVAALAMAADFVSAGSVYLVADEAQLDEPTKASLQAGIGEYQEIPDFFFPELGTRSWSFVRDPRLSQAMWKLYELYENSTADAVVLRSIASELPEPFGTRLRNVAEVHCGSDGSKTLRSLLRQEAKSALFPGIIPCDASISSVRDLFPRGEFGRPGLSAAQLSDFLCPQDSVH